MNDQKNQDKEQKLIDKYKILYSKYNYLKELKDKCFTNEEVKKDLIIRGPLLGISLLTIAMSTNQDLDLNAGIAMLISGEVLGGFFGGAFRTINYEIRMNKIEENLLSLATRLKIVSSNMYSVPYYVVYENKEDFNDLAKRNDDNVVNACDHLDPALGAAYKIVCKR